MLHATEVTRKEVGTRTVFSHALLCSHTPSHRQNAIYTSYSKSKYNYKLEMKPARPQFKSTTLESNQKARTRQ